jgi:ribosomal protein L17
MTTSNATAGADKLMAIVKAATGEMMKDIKETIIINHQEVLITIEQLNARVDTIEKLIKLEREDVKKNNRDLTEFIKDVRSSLDGLSARILKLEITAPVKPGDEGLVKGLPPNVRMREVVPKNMFKPINEDELDIEFD